MKHLTLRAKGLKAGDQWVVPICRTHHDAVEAAGDEAAWWRAQALNPVPLAVELWALSLRQGRGPRNAT